MKTQMSNILKMQKNIEHIEAKVKVLFEFLNSTSCMCCEGIEFMSSSKVLKIIERGCLKTIGKLQKIDKQPK